MLKRIKPSKIKKMTWPTLFAKQGNQLLVYRHVSSDQSHKASRLVNYDSRVVRISNLLVITILGVIMYECKMFIGLAFELSPFWIIYRRGVTTTGLVRSSVRLQLRPWKIKNQNSRIRDAFSFMKCFFALSSSSLL